MPTTPATDRGTDPAASTVSMPRVAMSLQFSAQTAAWLANRPHARTLVRSVWDRLRAGTGRSPPRHHCGAAVRSSAPPAAHSHGSVPHLPPLDVAALMASQPLAVRGVAPGPWRAVGIPCWCGLSSSLTAVAGSGSTDRHRPPDN